MKLILALLIMIMSVYAQNTREYYVSGKLRLEGTINDRGSKVGTWNEFYENGRLKKTIQYDYNRTVSEIEYSIKGKVTREVRYDGEYISYMKTQTQIREYVKGVLRYVDGVSQWHYTCDTIQVNTGSDEQHHQLCGYKTDMGNKVGKWNITVITASPDVMVHIDTSRGYMYAIYDTVSSELTQYVSGFYSPEYMIRGIKMGGIYQSMLEKTYSGFTYTLYTAWNSDKYMRVNNSLTWSLNHATVYSSHNHARNLTVYNCDNQEYMPNKSCPSYSTYGHEIERLESIYNRYK